MKGSRKLVAALGAIAVLAVGWGGLRAADAPAADSPSIEEMSKALNGVVAGPAIDDAIKTIDGQGPDQATLTSEGCRTFRALTTAAAIDAELARMQSELDGSERWLVGAKQTAVDAREAELAARERLSNAGFPVGSTEHTALHEAWETAQTRAQTAEANLNSTWHVIDQREAMKTARVCAAAAKAALAVSAEPAATSATAPAPSQPTLHGAVTIADDKGDRWFGRYSMQRDATGAYDGPLTWDQAPPNAGPGFQVGDQMQWTFMPNPSGDVTDASTVFGAMNGHIDPATRSGSGVFLGPCLQSGAPIPCRGGWTATP